jgi:hypothetical protein
MEEGKRIELSSVTSARFSRPFCHHGATSMIVLRALREIRTPDPQIRNLVRYPLRHEGMVSSERIELPASELSARRSNQLSYDDTAEDEGLEPTTVLPVTG